MKAKNNLIIKCNTAAFELTKAKLDEILHSKTFQLEYVVNLETVKDKTNDIVELRYKILNKRKDGSTGSYLKFTINVYNTTSSLLINSQKVDIFTESILQILEVTEESSTPIILYPDQDDQILHNQLSAPAPSIQPSKTPHQSSQQPTPSVCELSKDTPLTRPKSSSRSKTNKSVENRTYTIELEKRIREQEKTIDLLQKGEKLIGGGEIQSTFTNDQQPCQCAKPTYLQRSHTPLDYQYLNLQRQIEIQALESRLKAVETRTMQNLSIQTTTTTQLAIQIQQTINRLQSETAMPPYTMPTQMFFLSPPFQHGMQPPPYQPAFHQRHPPPTWYVPPSNFEPIYHPSTMGYFQSVPMNSFQIRTSKLHTNSSGINHQPNNATLHLNNLNHLGRNNDRRKCTNTSKIPPLAPTIISQPSRLTPTEFSLENNQNTVQDVNDQSAWIFQAKLTSTDNQAKSVIHSQENNEMFTQGSVQSAWEVQAKLNDAQNNHQIHTINRVQNN
ncbi:unnamed protein product [Mytilus coruscus]|uniref:Uncharacterized protein n=1 Tax=Mytilus coruscus TaxID=42192 RepID=A0A6J8A3H4_MYTCO|nr:unnamed protein product [Mytilus coruscus]